MFAYVGQGGVFAYVGLIQNLKNQKEAARREPSALKDWIVEILCCDSKGSRNFLWILSTEASGVRLCWEELNHQGRKGSEAAGPSTMKLGT